MELIRRFRSSRIAVGCFLLLLLLLICIWSRYITKCSFVLGSIVIAPVILWSIYEIFLVQFSPIRDKNVIPAYVFFNYFLIVSPSFIVAIFSPEDEFMQLDLWHLLLGVLLGSWIVFMFGFLLMVKDGRRNLSFPCILTIVFLFWNVILFMVMYSQWHWLAIVFSCSIMNDSFSHLFGRKWGKTCLSGVSPNKTQLGFVCGWFFSCLFVYVYLCIIPSWMKEDLFGISRSKNWWISIFFLVSGIFLGAMGDLYFSKYKRVLGIKDYSSLLGSHGGFWDRFDSHSFVFIFWFFCFLIWQNF